MIGGADLARVRGRSRTPVPADALSGWGQASGARHRDAERVGRQLLLGLHEQPHDPVAGEQSLPGVLLLRGERILAAAARALDMADLTARLQPGSIDPAFVGVADAAAA